MKTLFSQPSKYLDDIAKRYIMSGLIVTALSYVFLFIMIFFTSLDDVLSNFLTLVFGLVISFVFNKNFVFRISDPQLSILIRFVVAIGTAYVLNLLSLRLLLQIDAMPRLIAQFFAFSVYTVVAYIIHRVWTFKANAVQE